MAAVPSGDMESRQSERCTLDEPVTETIMRDLRSIGKKLVYVMNPIVFSRSEGGKGLREWDLWGPLLLCLVLAIAAVPSTSVVKQVDDSSKQAQVFALVFTVVWGGSGVVTLNAILLRGNISFFQSVCVLGYCICPLVVAAVLLLPLHWLCGSWGGYPYLKALLVTGAFSWACAASTAFMSGAVPGDRKALGVYPVVLFYVAISAMIMMK